MRKALTKKQKAIAAAGKPAAPKPENSQSPVDLKLRPERNWTGLGGFVDIRETSAGLYPLGSIQDAAEDPVTHNARVLLQQREEIGMLCDQLAQSRNETAEAKAERDYRKQVDVILLQVQSVLLQQLTISQRLIMRFIIKEEVV